MNEKYKLTIGHLYPEEMNIYGDLGNIITLSKRAEWRGIEVEVKNIGKGKVEASDISADLYFMGGGQDNDMYGVFEDMIEFKKDFVQKEVEKGKVFLLICGGFQLFGHYFLDAQGRTINGLKILSIETKAPGDALADRCLGNLFYNLTEELFSEISQVYTDKKDSTVIGFENHGGQVYFMDNSLKPIGNVIKGKGNNAKEGIEGARYKNVFGSFTHGSLLPKNPHIADYLLILALRNKYGSDFKLTPLDDQIEWLAHTRAIKKVVEGN